MASFMYITLLLGLVVKGLSAPIDEGAPRGHRDSTKAILNLEQELKQSAGEDKKFAPPDDSLALAKLAAEGAKINAEQEEQDQAELDELAALKDEAPGGLTLKQMHEIEQMDELQHEPVEDVNAAEQLEQLEQEPEVHEMDDEKKDTFKERIGMQSDKKSPYKVVAVSEKKSSAPVVPPHMQIPSEDYPAKNEHNEEFMGHFLKVIKEYPELMEFMNDPEAVEQYERMVLSDPDTDSDYLDRDEALQAEMLAAQQQQQLQQQGDYPELQQYNDYTEEQQASPHDNRELEQEFGARDLSHVVRAKKRGYDTPEEYLEWVRGGPGVDAEDIEPEDLQIHSRAAEMMEPLTQRSAEEQMKMAM